MRTSLFRTLLFLAISTVPVLAQQAPAPAATNRLTGAEYKPTLSHVDLKDGDTWVFLGDSITHQCLHTQYVEDFIYTRYPKTRVHFHNAGVSGDVAKDALNRFEDDVAAFKPKYVTILLGMNDGRSMNFQQPIFDTYMTNMSAILDRLTAIGATPIPMTPTMFDSRADRVSPRGTPIRQQYYNGVLALYGSWLREQAYERGLGFVDMWAPMNDITMEQRKKDPAWTMIADAVHPGKTGQVVMAVAVLNDIVQRSPVSQIVLGLEQGQYATTVKRGIAGNVRKTATGVTFDFTAESLPWVLPPDAAEGWALTRAGHRYSNEKIIVRDLPPGTYELKIDGSAVATATSGQFAAGLELQANEKTPQYQQALKVALLNQSRNDEAIRPLRDQWRLRKLQFNAFNKAREANAPDLAEKQKAFDEFVPPFQAKVKELIAKARGFEDQIYQANQPAVHHYEIVATQSAAKPGK